MGAFTAASTGGTKSTIYSPGTYVQSSGILAASGTSSTTAFHCGDWMVETQSMTINYARTPKYGWDGMATSSTLSGAATIHPVWNTGLETQVHAVYRRRKVNACYQTSEAVIQPQMFELNAVSADAQGMTYGPSSDWNTSCLGPMGTINTLTEWYFRRVWEAGDTEVYQHSDGFNCWAASAGDTTCQGNDNYLFGQFEKTPKKCMPGAPLGSWSPVFDWGNGAKYWINGPYSYAKESMAQIISFVDGTGSDVAAIGLHSNPTAMDPNYCWPTPSLGFSEYDSNRHAWIF